MLGIHRRCKNAKKWEKKSPAPKRKKAYMYIQYSGYAWPDRKFKEKKNTQLSTEKEINLWELPKTHTSKKKPRRNKCMMMAQRRSLQIKISYWSLFYSRTYMYRCNIVAKTFLSSWFRHGFQHERIFIDHIERYVAEAICSSRPVTSLIISYLLTGAGSK